MIPEILDDMSVDWYYAVAKDLVSPPFIVYLGAGQDVFLADNTIYEKENKYQIELYFNNKTPSLETELETLLLNNGYIYDKSDDIYINSENMFVIYYQI